MELFYNSLTVGMGISFGAIGAVGIMSIMLKSLKWLLVAVMPNKYSKWEFGKTYHDYQEVFINSSEWKVLPNSLKDVTVFRQLQGVKAITITEYDHYKDVSKGVNQTEAERQPETYT